MSSLKDEHEDCDEPVHKKQKTDDCVVNSMTRTDGCVPDVVTNTDTCVDDNRASDAEVLVESSVTESVLKSHSETESHKMYHTEEVLPNSRETSMDECGIEELSAGYLMETDVGVTEYISGHRGFDAVIKQRFSDFIVNEISADGKIIRLTDISEPVFEPEKSKDVSLVITEEYRNKLQALIDNRDKSASVVIPVGNDKGVRRDIHQAIRVGFSGLESTTEEKDGEKVIKVTFQKCGDVRGNWPSTRGNYCRFVLYKENKDTMDAINLIAKTIRRKPNTFQYAGTKDRRAKTSQEITVYRKLSTELYELNKTLRYMSVGNFKYVKEPLKLGKLNGNKFVIVLRNVTGTEEVIEEAVKSLQDHGFINYYGMQRFGTTAIPTHHIGRAILLSNWKEAVEMILKPRPNDEESMRECRRVWWDTRDSQKALKLICKRHSIEMNLLNGLDYYGGNNYANALATITRNIRLMYVHSYQSYIWNSMASERIKSNGLSPAIGDLVSTSTDHGDSGNREIPVLVSEENINAYSIYDVVLPLPGFDVIYPDNDIKALYTEILAKDGLDINNMRHSLKEYSLPGAYRKILTKPGDVSWQMYKYNDITLPLALSDIDVLNKVPEPETIEEGQFRALKLNMTLPSSCYATMAIREILKTDTSAGHQRTLNV